MYQQETITKELHLQLSDEDLAQFELDAKETERLGHIGTHMDCYMEAPRYKEYVTEDIHIHFLRLLYRRYDSFKPTYRTETNI